MYLAREAAAVLKENSCKMQSEEFPVQSDVSSSSALETWSTLLDEKKKNNFFLASKLL